MLKIYTDAAVKGNPGKAGIGFVLIGKERYEQLAFPLEGDQWNNHLAEMEAIKQALSWSVNEQLTDQLLFLYSDSKTAIEAINKKYAKNPQFQIYTEEILSLMEQFPAYVAEWIPEKDNKGADNLARQALRKAGSGLYR